MRLTDADIVDFMVGGIAIEIKLRGAKKKDVYRQLCRYARHDRVEMPPAGLEHEHGTSRSNRWQGRLFRETGGGLAMRTYGSIALCRDEQHWVIQPRRTARLDPSQAALSQHPEGRRPSLSAPAQYGDGYRSSLVHAALPARHLRGRPKIPGRWPESFLKRQAEMERILLPTYKPPKQSQLREGQELRQYQWQAIEVLRRRGRLLLGDEGGLGKTYTAAGFMVMEPDAATGRRRLRRPYAAPMEREDRSLHSSARSHHQEGKPVQSAAGRRLCLSRQPGRRMVRHFRHGLFQVRHL